MFQGFTPETNEFLWGILLNNNREWFMPHKEQYNRALYQPLKELASEIQEKFLTLHPDRQLNCKVARIYRDLRMPRKDGPYKTELWFSLRAPGDRWSTSPSLFFGLSGENYMIGMDFFCGKPAIMEAFRQRILRDPESIEALTLKLQSRPEFQLNGPRYKRSKGTVSELAQPWFDLKSLWIAKEGPGDDELIMGRGLVDEILDDFEFLLPFYDYFAEPFYDEADL